MARFSERSLKALEGVHPKLVDVLLEVIQYYDFTVLEGLRSAQTQAEYFALGKSKTLNSKHLRQSDGYSHAVDIVPYPIDWNDYQRFAFLAGLIIATGKSKGVDITWGHDWDGDGDLQEHRFKDSPHFELKGD